MFFTKCYVDHIIYIQPQAEQISEAANLLSPVGRAVIESSYAMTAWAEIGKPVGAAGVLDYWRGRAYAWALLSPAASHFMLPISRRIRSVLAEYDARRIEMTVSCDHQAAHRWAKMLGFEVETERMRGYNPDGSDATMYVRLKG